MQAVRGKLIAIALLSVIVWLGFLWWNAGEPARVASTVVEGIRQRQWQVVFGYLTKEEIAANRWDLEKFQKLCEGLTRHLPAIASGHFSEQLVPIPEAGNVKPGLQEQPLGRKQSERHFLWTLPRENLNVFGKPAIFQIEVVRDASRNWRVIIGPNLLLLNRCNRSDPEATLRNLRDSLINANLPYFCWLRGRSIITPEKLALRLEGRIEAHEIWDSLPTQE